MNPYRLVVMMGLISLFADIASSGARSVVGPYMQVLGASGFVVSFVAGFGELLGYGLRIVSGHLSDKTQRYWPFAIFGYLVSLVSVPLMGFAKTWPTIAVWVFTERVGKAIRAPARDTIISYGARNIGTGAGYGLHQALDLVGSLTGPIVVSALLLYGVEYRISLLWLVVPALVAMFLMVSAQRNFPNPEKLEPRENGEGEKSISPRLWVYIIAVSLVGMGFSDFPLIAYHVKKNMIMADSHIPLLYSLTMVVGALTAFYFGRMFDRIGIYAVAVGVAFSTGFSYCAFMGGIAGVILGIVLWGVGIGVQESIIRAAIANIIHASARGRVFGLFNASYGIFSFVGSAAMGFLYDISVVYLVYFSVACHVLAFIALLLIAGKSLNGRTAPSVP